MPRYQLAKLIKGGNTLPLELRKKADPGIQRLDLL